MNEVKPLTAQELTYAMGRRQREATTALQARLAAARGAAPFINTTESMYRSAGPVCSQCGTSPGLLRMSPHSSREWFCEECATPIHSASDDQ